MVVIKLELPDLVKRLLERDPLLREILENTIRRKALDILLEILALDELLRDSQLTEEDIIELDRILKSKAWEKLKDHAVSNGY